MVRWLLLSSSQSLRSAAVFVFWLVQILTLKHIMLPNYNDVLMGTMASQITSLTIVYSIVYSGADQRKHQSSASLTFVRGIHRGPVNSPHKTPVTQKMFPFDDVIMIASFHWNLAGCIPSGYVLRYPRSTLDVVALLVSAVCFYGNHPGSNSNNCTALFSIERIIIALGMGAGVLWGPVGSPCLASVWSKIFLRLLVI